MSTKPTFIQILHPEELDLYSIDDDGKGGKEIHISGYTYHSDDHWEYTDVCWFIEPLEEFVQHVKEDSSYAETEMSEYKQYFYDRTEEEIVDIVNHYFDGSPPDRRLSYSEITLDTPCGNYIT